jgi:hypothetical protein
MKSRFFLSLFPALLLFFSCIGVTRNSSLDADVRAGRSPAWVTSVDSVYSRSQYAAATGYASSRAKAEENALAALVSFFGQSVQVETNAASSYRQAVVNGVTDGWIDTAQMSSVVKTRAFQDNLLGAEIKEVWFDSKDTYYAVAVMEKERSAGLYNEMILANLNIIKNLTAMTPNEKNTLDGVIRYQFAAVVADINISYRNMVRLLDFPAPDGIKSGDEYRLEARNIAKSIPIGIRVTYDRQGRIFGAFAKCFADLGFDTNTGNSRYVLNANVAVSPVDYPNNQNYFSRIEIAANLTDTNSSLVLLPYNFNDRQGHITQAEAENRAIASAQRDINEKFADALSEYLSRLMPR